MIRSWLTVGGVVLVLWAGCKTREPPVTPRSARQALTELRRAVAPEGGGASRVFDLLDKKSRWSLMSVHRTLRKACDLVAAHYPAARKQRAQRRCALAARSPTAEAFFAALARQQRLLEGLAPAGPVSTAGEGDGRVTLRVGERRLQFCQEGGVWGYCGWRERFDGLKVKAARDLETIQENVEAFRGSR